MKYLLYKTSFLLFFLSSLFFILWGSNGHTIISGNSKDFINQEILNKFPDLAQYIRDHASDPDYRKNNDPNESPKHFIDIDSYPEFNQYGLINQDYYYNVNLHGLDFITSKGTLPWAIVNTYDSLKSSFMRNDKNRILSFASDLGHYIGDMHMPLHLTKNYDGQMTNQRGIHSRYETDMISRYSNKINYSGQSSNILIENISDYIFNRIYSNYRKKDSILQADVYAFIGNGNAYNDPYFDTLWIQLNSMTILLMKDASKMLGDLINTAYQQAIWTKVANNDPIYSAHFLSQNYPNPFNPTTRIKYFLPEENYVEIKIFDLSGKEIKTLVDKILPSGEYETLFEPGNVSSGVYIYRILFNSVNSHKSYTLLKKMILLR